MKLGVIKVQTNPKVCQGCRACEAICSMQHFGLVKPKASGINIRELKEPGKFSQTVCQQCIDMPCARACPENAIKRNTYSGAVVIEDNCTVCGKCAEACPIHAITMVEFEEGIKPVKCDLCGGSPQCISICPRQALEW